MVPKYKKIKQYKIIMKTYWSTN